ncbi:gastrula zinc finger protein XlCGF8.2DB-like [Nerophis ophidion]|uniref:gastrula zinc finger protein XlCGF8.2DB-like n=1 Tax=Nerophis ophidion TaxID=159077 RepID=UPI002ADFEE38|nr:gastrula zinc finger protein XlCGF8.2DB-like [Nerophis ophidion]
MLKELVKERLMAAADEIFALFESTITSYEEELSRTREEKERHRQQLEAARKTQIVLHVEGVQQQEERPPTPQEGSSKLKHEFPQPPHVKEEEQELWISQSGGGCFFGLQDSNPTTLPLTGVSVKTEDHEDKPQVDNLLAPLSDSDDITSHSIKDKDKHYIQEPLSSDTDCEGDTRTHNDNQHLECSAKKTVKTSFICSFGANSLQDTRNFAPQTRTHTGEKPFNCSVCGSTFSRKDYLTKHMRTHTGEKPFSCSYCGLKFSRTYCLKIHMRRHTGERPFICSVCGKKYCRNDSLQLHMRKHTVEIHFICPVCRTFFADEQSLTAHISAHNGHKM